jgi:hypothetical protein
MHMGVSNAPQRVFAAPRKDAEEEVLQRIRTSSQDDGLILAPMSMDYVVG